MIYPIVLAGNPVLRQKTADLPAGTPDLAKLVDDMFETMYAADGVGLAAPQIGKPLRLLVVDCDPLGEDFPEAKGFKRAFINPTITEESGELWAYNEGCLSIPGIHEDVVRRKIVTIRYLDTEWNEHTETLGGVPARVIQHEYDHLEGRIFTDKLSPIRKRLLRGKLNDIASGHARVSYRVRLK